MLRPSPIRRPAVCVFLALSAFAATPTPATNGEALDSAYLEGKPVQLAISQPEGKERPQMAGPWRFGAKVKIVKKGDPGKPHDTRLNLYFVVPGEQHKSALVPDPAFDHNLIINALPIDPEAGAEYDVYWALVLDPRLRTDFRNEKDLILATQEDFYPGDLLEFDDLPSSAFLEKTLNLTSLVDLRKWRRKNAALPRVLIVPADFAVRASVTVTATE